MCKSGKKSLGSSVALAMLSAAALAPSPARACGDVLERNQSGAKFLQEQTESLQALEEKLATWETECQTAESKIAANGAAAAGARSCVALKENATMNSKLKEVSQSCTLAATAIHENLSTLLTQYIEPLELLETVIVARDNRVVDLHASCPAEATQAAQLRDAASRLLERSRQSVASSQAAMDKYRRLADETGKIAALSTAGFDRCGSETGTAFAMAPSPGQARPERAAPPAIDRVPPQGLSSLTGIEKDALQRQEGQALIDQLGQ